jgi:hypothetical protein
MRKAVKIAGFGLLGVVVLIVIIVAFTPSGRKGFQEGYNGTTTVTPQPDPDLRPGPHHVIYTWGVSRKLKGDEWQKIGLGWTNPGTGIHEHPPETDAASTNPLRFPYSVQFDVTDLHVDNQHVAALATADLSDVAVDCTITIDGQKIVVEPGKKAVMGANGTVETGGGSLCVPHNQ